MARIIVGEDYQRRLGFQRKFLLEDAGHWGYWKCMIPLLIAGGSMAAVFTAPELPDMNNHLLNGNTVLAKEVVCRTRWGTPMMPDGKGSYSLIAPADPVLIERSLIQPPKTDAPVYTPGKPYILPSQAAAAAEPQKAAEPTVAD
jgi:hypothetical protein